MLRLPDQYDKVDKELLKRVICFVIDNYYESDFDVIIDSKVINDEDILDLRYIDQTTSYGIYQQQASHVYLTPNELEDVFSKADIGFSEALIALIDRTGLTDAQVYNKALVNRSAFNRIKNTPSARVSKPIALAFAAALELNISETSALLEKAGLCLSKSDKFDLIVYYCFSHHIYNVFKINEMLSYFDLELLGSKCKE